MKKRYKFLFIFIFIASLPVAGVVYFIFKNEAPITKGRIDYNINYSKDFHLDIYYPTKDLYQKSPVLLFIHGGGWMGGIKETVNNGRFNGAFNTLRENGYTIISPEYTLAEKNVSAFPACIINGFEVVDWIYHNAEKYNLDINNFGLMGESAGGHIALMNSLAEGSDFDRPELIKLKVNYVVDVYGPTYLWGIYQSSTVDSLNKYVEYLPENLQEMFNIPELLFGFEPKEDTVKAKEFADKHSPINYVGEDMAPTLIIHGIKDQIVPVDQSYRMEALLENRGVEYYSHYLEGVNHGFIDITTRDKENVQKWISDFILSKYTTKEPI